MLDESKVIQDIIREYEYLEKSKEVYLQAFRDILEFKSIMMP